MGSHDVFGAGTLESVPVNCTGADRRDQGGRWPQDAGLSKKAESIDSRRGHVDEDEIGRRSLDELECRGLVSRGLDDLPRMCQLGTELLLELGIIGHDERSAGSFPIHPHKDAAGDGVRP